MAEEQSKNSGGERQSDVSSPAREQQGGGNQHAKPHGDMNKHGEQQDYAGTRPGQKEDGGQFGSGQRGTETGK